MKKLVVVLVILSVRMISQTNNPAPYCLSSYTSTSNYPEISMVEVNGPVPLVNATTKTPAPGYTFYNNVGSPALGAAVSYTLKVTFKNVDAETMLKAWIDYNNDQIFTSNELIMSIPQGSVGTGMAVIKQAGFTPNVSCASCQSRLRVSLGWHYANWGNMTFRLDSCHNAATGDGSAGETEDYPVQLFIPVGMKEIQASEKLSVLPNPAHEELSVTNVGVDTGFIIVNGCGSIAKEGRVGESGKIRVEDLSTGIYFIRVNDKGVEKRATFVKE